MAYVPDPTDVSQPTDSIIAETAQAEFRALKAYIQTLVLNGTVGSRVAVRQSVQDGDKNASGNADIIGIGALLTADLKAATSSALLAFANGFTNLGGVDYIYSLAATVGYWTGLTGLVTNFLSADYVDNVTPPVATKFLVPPQYGYTFDKSKGALLNFQGVDASTSMIDDFGNTWTANGNAQLDTAQFKFGTSSLLLDGTTDYLSTTDILWLGDGGWELSTWFRIAVLPTAGNNVYFFNLANAGGFGLWVGINNNGGTIKLILFASSDGGTYDIANGSLGANTVWALNQWNKIRVTFDPLSGNYRFHLSLNGANETVDLTVASTARICRGSLFTVGAATTGASSFNGWLASVKFIASPVALGAIVAPEAVMPVISNIPYHFFNTTEMKMYEITGASVAAGTNPVMTQRNRLFIGEMDMGAAAGVTARSYAFQGKYFGVIAGVAASTGFVFNHNLGVPREQYTPKWLARGLVSISNINSNWGEVVAFSATPYPYPIEVDNSPIQIKRNFIRGATGNGGAFFNAQSWVTATQFQLGLQVQRNF